MAGDFRGARLKIERAEHHTRDFYLQSNKFIRNNPHELSVKKDSVTGDDLIYITPARPLPQELLLILGDAIHNLRAALDYAWFEMVFTPHDFTRFPIRETGEKFKDAINGVKSNAPRTIIDFLRTDVQPYKGGKGEPIWKLDCLDVTDKHKLLIAHIEYRTISGICAIDDRGEEFTIAHWLLVAGNVSRHRCSGHRNIQISNPGRAIDHIVFGPGMAFETAHILPILKNLTIFVTETINDLERVFFKDLTGS